jgi:hypothetical protein
VSLSRKRQITDGDAQMERTDTQGTIVSIGTIPIYPRNIVTESKFDVEMDES